MCGPMNRTAPAQRAPRYHRKTLSTLISCFSFHLRDTICDCRRLVRRTKMPARSTIQLRQGDMFAQPTDLIIIPCSTGGTITPTVAEALEAFDIRGPRGYMN